MPKEEVKKLIRAASFDTFVERAGLRHIIDEVKRNGRSQSFCLSEDLDDQQEACIWLTVMKHPDGRMIVALEPGDLSQIWITDKGVSYVSFNFCGEHVEECQLYSYDLFADTENASDDEIFMAETISNDNLSEIAKAYADFPEKILKQFIESSPYEVQVRKDGRRIVYMIKD